MNLGFLPLRFFVCLNQEEFNRVRQELTDVEDDGPYVADDQDALTRRTWSHKIKHHIVIVCMSKDVLEANLERLVEVAAHEAMHVVQSAEHVMAEKNPGDEYPAYLIGKITAFIVTEALKGASK